MIHYVKNYFGFNLQLHFIASDAARHMKFALNLVNTGNVDLNMYFHSLSDALAMHFFSPFISTVMGQAKVFTITSITDLVLMGLLFYSTLRPLMKTKSDFIIGNLLLFLYICCYPLYIVQFGFSYYISAIIIIEFIIIIAIKYLDNSSLDYLLLLNLALFSLFVSYTFLIPVTYFSLFIAVFWKRFKLNKKDIVNVALEEIKNHVLSSFIIVNIIFTFLIFILCMKG